MATPSIDNGGVVDAGGLSQGASDGVTLGLYDVTTTQPGRVGARRVLPSGEVFRLGYFAVAVGPGKLCATDRSVSATGYLTAKVTNSAGTQADAAAGDTEVYLLDTDTFDTDDREDLYAGGTLHIVNEGGEGHTYHIKGNSQGGSDGSIRLDLYDGLVVQLDSEDVEVAIQPCAFNDLTIASATDTQVVGVTMVDMAAGEYGWVQCWGRATVLADENAGTIDDGVIAQLSDGVNGAAQPFGGGAVNSEDDHSYETEPIIGYFLDPCDDADHVPVMLQITQ